MTESLEGVVTVNIVNSSDYEVTVVEESVKDAMGVERRTINVNIYDGTNRSGDKAEG